MIEFPFKNRSKLTAFVAFMSISIVTFVDSAGVQALQTYYKSDVSTELYKVDILGETPGEQFGADVARGDINGDNVDDLVVGSPFYSSDGRTWNGKISVFFGAISVGDKVVDLKDTAPSIEIYGRGAGDQLGTSIDCGDFNGDGYDDIAIGAYNASSDKDRPGKVFLFLGYKDITPSFIDLSTAPADMEFVGDNDGDGFGFAVKVADINHDGFDDVLVGAPFSVSSMSTSGRVTGNVYGYFGSKRYVDNVDSPVKFFGEQDATVVFAGHKKGERFGSAIEVGNFIEGTFNDLAISAYFADDDAGEQVGNVYLYSGVKRYRKYTNIQDGLLVGTKPYGWFGFALASGRVNGDEYDDLMVSSFPYSDRSKRGATYVLLGKEGFGEFADDGVNRKPFEVGFDTADYGFSGGRGDSFMGASLGIGDFDHDGKNDFVIGAPGVGVPKAMDPGEVYFYYKNQISDRMPFDVKKDELTSLVRGDYSDDWFGAKLVVFDYNGDGFDDVAVSARYSDRRSTETNSITESNNGKVTILLGHSSPFGEAITKPDPGDENVTRGEFVSAVVDKFQIKQTRKDFIDDCYSHREFCFYAFMGFSNFDGIKLNPDLVLYPDVPVGSKYYEPINIATLLGAVSGNGAEADTPFDPDGSISRVQALKVILSINQLVKPMYKFELVSELGGSVAVASQRSYYKDVNPAVPSNWWYPRFTNFAYDNSLIEDRKYFRPDDILTKNEMNALIDRTLSVIGENR